MEGQPPPTPLETSDYFSDRRKAGLVKLGIYAMFENQMNLADAGTITREQALARIRALRQQIEIGLQERT